MNLNNLFELFDIEEERRFNDELNGPEPFGASIEENKYKKAYENFVRYYETYSGGTTRTGENLDAIGKYNLKLEEAAIIYMYTSHGIHSDVNMQLRDNRDRLDKDIKEYCRLLNRALDKMPSFDNGIVYRDISHPYREVSDILDEFEQKVGDIYLEPAFISSHIREGRWCDDEFGIQIKIFTKENSNGKDLRELSFNIEETEVLFKSSTEFLVEMVCRKNNYIELRELNPAANMV